MYRVYNYYSFEAKIYYERYCSAGGKETPHGLRGRMGQEGRAGDQGPRGEQGSTNIYSAKGRPEGLLYVYASTCLPAYSLFSLM